MITRFKQTFAAAALCAVAAIPAYAQDQAVSADTVLATVNGVNITVGHVVALRGQLPEQYQSLPDEVLYNGIVDQLIQQTVLQQSMDGQMDKRMQLSMENEQRAFVANEALNRLSADNAITDEDLQALYDERYGSVEPEKEFNASHILVETEDEAKDLVQQLADGADFAELAKEHSTGPSGPNGGQLGWFGKGMMVEPFETAVLGMEKGAVAGPVQTQFGWHVIKLNDTRDKPAPTLEDVRADMTAELQRSRLDAAIGALTDKADVVRNDDGIDPAVIRDASIFATE